MSESAKPLLIKRYASRRLYNTESSDYVTLEDIAGFVRAGREVQIIDLKTGDDLTRQYLLQIIADHESRGENVLPLDVLNDLVRSYTAQAQSVVPQFLAMSFEMLREGPGKFAEQMKAMNPMMAQLSKMPGFEAMQYFSLTPLFADVRFGRWQQVADTPSPASDLPYMVAMWHYAQGLAAVRQGRDEDARRHHATLAKATDDPAIEAMMSWERYSLVHGLRIGERVLAAEIAAAVGDDEAAIAAFREAMAIEDELPYDEPPGWHLPVRHSLGAMLVGAGRPAEAEEVYREELRRNPENGWSLFGLSQALLAQGQDDEAAAVNARFGQAWAQADIVLSASAY